MSVLHDVAAEDRAVAQLRTTDAIRERAQFLLARAEADHSPWFAVHAEGLERAADEVAAVTRERFPDLEIPYHSRWRHFEAGGVDRKALLDNRLDAHSRINAHIDLTVVSVLLDAGAGPSWRFHEAESGQEFTRSEGLGVASWHAFTAGLFSSAPDDPLRVDAEGLRALTVPRLAEVFQVRADNPLTGLEGRVTLLHRLADALDGPQGRPAALFRPLGSEVSAHDLLNVVLERLSGIWLSGSRIGQIPLGDVWRHESVPGPGPSRGWMPLHKLSQWLTYSLLEPMQWAGVRVRDLDALTGLAEYRNGGLLLDTHALRLRDPEWAEHIWSPADEIVVEWRALTVALLDRLAPLVRERLGVDAHRMPLACVLEGGTWTAGRRLAARLRDGLPPLPVRSDGTVF
jgi:hypothetical protein